MLTEGYLRGWLTFQYPHIYSKKREAFILRYLETQMLGNLASQQAMYHAVIGAGLKDESRLKHAGVCLKEGVRFTLPYLIEQAKLKGEEKQDLKKLRDLLKAKRTELNATAAAKKDNG